MLTLTIKPKELWDEKNEQYLYTKEQKICLEHSLVSVSKWEAKWKVPFISKDKKTKEQLIDYIKFMTITQNVDDIVYNYLSDEEVKKVVDYIEDPMTATWFNKEQNNRRSSEQVTSELVYYWMVALGIPMECQKWHFNRLMTLIRVCHVKNEPPKKKSQKTLASERAALNAARKAKYGTKG